MAKRNFECWMRKVDEAIDKTCGLSSLDLMDMSYLDMFEDGYTPKGAANEALREEGYYD